MAAIKDVLAYLLQNYDNPRHFSAARVTKMVYLADWKHSIEHGSQVTSINWYYNHYGPFVDKVVNTAKSHPRLFETTTTTNLHGNPKQVIKCVDNSYQPNLTSSEKSTLNHVIDTTSDLNWDEFIKLVYSTYPVIKQEQHTTLPLPELAEDYKTSELYGGNQENRAAPV